MASPFRKGLVTGISEPNRTGLAFPIGIDPISMHRHNALGAKTPAPITDKALERPFNVVVGRVLTEALVGQIGSSLKERICNLFVHGRMVQRGFGFFNSHFPSPDSFVHGVTVCRGNANKNVRGAQA